MTRQTRRLGPVGRTGLGTQPREWGVLAGVALIAVIAGGPYLVSERRGWP